MTAQIKVGNNLVKPKAIHVFKNGEWQKERMGYVYKSGQWMPIIEYIEWLYREGNFDEYWELIKEVPGYSNLIKNDDHLFLESKVERHSGGNVRPNETVISCTNPINTTNLSKISASIDIDVNDSNCYLSLFISNKVDGDPLLETTLTEVVQLEEISLDVSDVSGDVFVGFIAYAGGYSIGIKVTSKIYRVWAE